MVKTIKVGNAPAGVSLGPDGRSVYVANEQDNNISVIDSTTDRVVKTLPTGGKFPVDILFTDDGRRAFISHRDSSDVTILDLTTEKVVKSLGVVDSMQEGVAQK